MKDYLPARLAQLKDRWYFVYYQTDPVTKKRRRHRESFDIGRIPIDQRVARGQEVISYINSRLPYGYPYDKDFYAIKVSMSASAALAFVLEQSQDLRHATIKSYESSSRKFEKFLTTIGLAHQPVDAITRQVAQSYSDHLTRSGLSARSHNNDINEMKRVFNILKDREIIPGNPFQNIARRKVTKKIRQPISHTDALIILDYLKKNDVSVYLSCLLLYYCFIRPNEQRQLKRSNILLDQSMIFIPGHVSKNRKDGYVTIPDQFKKILLEIGIDNLLSHHHLLGSKHKIGNDHPVGKITMGTRYRVILRLLKKKNLLADITGNSIYSWKDTGADALSRSGINGVSLKDQLRHHSLEETQAYLSDRHTADPFVKQHHRLIT